MHKLLREGSHSKPTDVPKRTISAALSSNEKEHVTLHLCSMTPSYATPPTLAFSSPRVPPFSRHRSPERTHQPHPAKPMHFTANCHGLLTLPCMNYAHTT